MNLPPISFIRTEPHFLGITSGYAVNRQKSGFEPNVIERLAIYRRLTITPERATKEPFLGASLCNRA
jgi:hypothetical protein